MGYFASQEEAESLLAAVRDVYPAAWAGPAPSSGIARRGKIAPVNLAPNGAAAAAAASVPTSNPVPPVPAADLSPEQALDVLEPQPSRPKAGVAPDLEDTMSNVRAVLADLSDEPAAKPKDEAKVEAKVEPKVEAKAAPAPKVEPKVEVQVEAKPEPKPEPVLELTLLESEPRPEPPRLQPATPPVAKPVAAPPVAKAPVPAPVAPKAAPVAAAAPAPEPKAAPVVAKAASPKPIVPELPPLASPFEGLENEPAVRVVTPEDTQTLSDIKLDAQNNAPPCFAVQLIWSATPIDINALPHLAIFDAYTLYNVEGNRQGRRWYGLRLGFFSDPNSATQVANYVRSDYRSVAIVPVANKERDRASGAATPEVKASVPAAPLKPQAELTHKREDMGGFELLTDERPVLARRDIEAPAAPAAPTVNAAAPKPAAGKPAGKRVVVRKRPDVKHETAPGASQVLESTLEILGASTLSLDDSGRRAVSDAAARKPDAAKKPGNSKFSKLLSRLGGG
jgi:hypothetical protein